MEENVGKYLFSGLFSDQLKSRDEVLTVLRQSKAELKRKYRVTDLMLYGYVLDGGTEPNCPVDILVRFKGQTTFNKFFGTKSYLETQLGCSVRLATEANLRDEVRPYVMDEGVHV